MKKKPQIIFEWRPIVGTPETMRTTSRWVCKSCGEEQYRHITGPTKGKSFEPVFEHQTRDWFEKRHTCGGEWIMIKGSWRLETLQEVK